MAEQANFSWAAAADVGLGAAGGIAGLLTTLGANKVADANADAANTVRQAVNEENHSATSLAGAVRSINNTRAMERRGDAYNAASTNIVRTAEAFTRSGFEDSIRNAEIMGAQTARLVGAGVGGAGIRAISRVSQLTQERAREAMEQRQGQISYDDALALAGLAGSSVSGIEYGNLASRTDRNINFAQQRPLFDQLLAGLLSKKDSVQTFLGSLTSASDKTNAGVIVGGPMERGSAEGTPLSSFDWAQPSPVIPQTDLQGTALPNITLN